MRQSRWPADLTSERYSCPDRSAQAAPCRVVRRVMTPKPVHRVDRVDHNGA